MLVRFRRSPTRARYRSQSTCLSFLEARKRYCDMAIFHLSIRPISRAKGHSAVAQVAYDTRCKLTNERSGKKLDWSKHKQDVIQWQIIGPNMRPGELAARAEQAEKRWDARVGRAMDVALPNELSTKAQWDLLRGFGLQLRDTYGAALSVSLHHPTTKGDIRNVHGHVFMTSRAVDEEGNFSKTKIRNLDDRKLGPVEVERIREMWEARCNRALRKAGFSEGIRRRSLKAQGIKRAVTQHLGPKATAMTRNGYRLKKAEGWKFSPYLAAWRRSNVNFNISRRIMPIEFPPSNRHDHESTQARNQIWQQRATRIDPVSSAKPTGWLCVENRALPITEIDLLEIIPGRGLHIRTRQESWLISLPEELQSDELLQAITSGEVNCLSGSCEAYEQVSEFSNSSEKID
jgi:MobA/MobL family